MKPRYWLARSVIASWAGYAGVVPMLNPDALVAQALRGSYGAAFLLALVIFSVIALVDGAVNDLLPERFIFARALNSRHIGFSCIAVVCLLLGSVVCLHTGRASVAMFYFLPGLFAALITWLDLFARLAARRKAVS